MPDRVTVETNLARLAEATLARTGDYPSLYFDGVWHTSGSLHERASRVAGGLRAAGVRPGDRVVVVMANCPEVHITYEALWRVGAVATPVVFLVTAPELRHILIDSGAVAIITTPELLPKVEAAQAGAAPADATPADAAPTEGAQTHAVQTEAAGTAAVPIFTVGGNYAELEAAESGAIADRTADDLAALLYTGGTTGRSKGVALSHANLSNAGASSRSVSHVPGLVRGISGLPLSHSFGLLVTVGGLHAPEPVESILQRWFEPADWLRLASELHAQTTAVVPSMLAILLAHPLESYDLGSLRFVYSGGAPLSAAVAAEFERRVPSARVLEGYGCTETGGIISGSPPLAPRRGTVGRAVPGVTIRIIDPGGTPSGTGSPNGTGTPNGTDLPTGTDGEIVVRGANVMSHYWRGDPLPGGWFATGDVGRLDEDGYLTIVDRIKDLILRGGYNVYPRDVEDVLMTHPAVAMAAVVGRPDDRLGEEVVGFVSLTDGASVTPEELIAYARERLGAHKYPRDIRIVATVPLTSVGKLDRKRLRAAAADPAAS